MKVLIVNTSDTKGGAAVVSFRLMHALRGMGVDARMLVADRQTADPHVAEAGSRYERRTAFLAERLEIALCNGLTRHDLFKVSTASAGVRISRHPWVQQADILCLNWINQGFVSLDEIRRLAHAGKKIVWTMHDMWCCTGICHHAYACRRFEEDSRCGLCPFLHRLKFSGDLSRRTWLKKKSLYDACRPHFVAVSNWLANRCRHSGLFAGQQLSVIPNALPVDSFSWTRDASASGATTVAVGAARLDDPVKGFDLLLEAADIIARRIGKDGVPPVRLLLFGGLRDRSLLDRINLPYDYLGPVAPDNVPSVYRRSDIVVSSSHYETLPTTLVEGLASGCRAVAFDHGGQADIINHLDNGYLARYPDADDLANGILWAARQDADRQRMHDSVASKFSENSVAQQYIDLFSRL